MLLGENDYLRCSRPASLGEHGVHIRVQEQLLASLRDYDYVLDLSSLPISLLRAVYPRHGRQLGCIGYPEMGKSHLVAQQRSLQGRKKGSETRIACRGIFWLEPV